jgi:hypothetical protein
MKNDDYTVIHKINQLFVEMNSNGFVMKYVVEQNGESYFIVKGEKIDALDITKSIGYIREKYLNGE